MVLSPWQRHAEGTRTISVLDLFGFETLPVNGFEQLCINYANEQVHHLFTEHCVAGEVKDYAREGVPLEDVHFNDNSEVGWKPFHLSMPHSNRMFRQEEEKKILICPAL
eukprot:1176993-Prorocentrum_minimum.AAC.7